MRDERGWPLPQVIGTRGALREATPALVRRGQWVCLNVQPSVAWPVRAQSLIFAGQEVWVIPLTQEEHPGVAMDCPAGMEPEEAEAILYRLLSVIAWREKTGLAVAHRTSGSWPMMMGLDKSRGFAIRQEFDFTDVICPEEVAPRIALGLVREARSLNHAGYAFLSYWRVLELAYPEAAARTAWMQAAFPTLEGPDVPAALESIRSQGVDDVCRHLYASGRCAIAHATGDPIINPDDPRDARRLLRELPLAQALAVRAIEDRFGIDSPSKEFREHLYELRGWRRTIGADLVARILAREEFTDDQTVDLPDIAVRLRDRPGYGAFEGMRPEVVHAADGLLHLEYRSPDRLAAIRFALDFENERLVFDLAQGVFGHDDGSAGAARHLVDARRFIRDMMLNGELQMWDHDTGELISRLDAFMPVNCMVDLDASNASVDEAEVEVERRLAAVHDAGSADVGDVDRR